MNGEEREESRLRSAFYPWLSGSVGTVDRVVMFGWGDGVLSLRSRDVSEHGRAHAHVCVG